MKPSTESTRKRTRESIYVIPFENAGGTASWRVSGMHEGKQVRKNFPTEAQAMAYKDTLLIAQSNIESALVRRPTWLSEEQLREAEVATKALGGRPLSMAVDYFNQHYTEPVVKITVREALEKFLAQKRLDNLREDSLTNLRTRIGFLVKDHGDFLVSNVSHEHLRRIIFTDGRSAVTADNVRRALSSFFNWAMDHRYCQLNPMLAIKRIKLERDEPEVLTVAQARQLVETAAAYKNGVILPYIALALFAGIRPTELSRLTWDAIDLEAGTVTINAKLAKMRQRRIVEMVKLTQKNPDGTEVTLPANLVGWLLPHAARKTPLSGVNWRRDFDKVKRLAGWGTKSKKHPDLKPWTQDIMRHTAITHHLAHFQHEGKTATWAGNSPDIVQRHYKGLVKPAESAEFWAITADQANNKIALHPAAVPAAVPAAATA